jgi:hypothetical protein
LSSINEPSNPEHFLEEHSSSLFDLIEKIFPQLDQKASYSDLELEALKSLSNFLNLEISYQPYFERKIFDFIESLITKRPDLNILLLDSFSNFLKNNTGIAREFMAKSFYEGSDIIALSDQSKSPLELIKNSKSNQEFLKQGSIKRVISNKARSIFVYGNNSSKNDQTETPTKNRRFSYSENLLSNEGIESEKCIIYMKAISRNWISDPNYWTKKIGPSSIILFWLIQLSSNLQKARITSLEFFDAFSKAEGDELRKYFGIKRSIAKYAAGMPDMVTLNSNSYSLEYSCLNWNLLPDVLNEAVSFLRIVKERNKENILNLLHPWACIFGQVAKSQNLMYEETREYTFPVKQSLYSLFEISKLCSYSQLLFKLAAELWCALLSDAENLQLSCAAVFSFLMKQLVDTDDEEDRLICKRIFLKITTVNPRIFISQLISRIRTYCNEDPSNFSNLLIWNDKKATLSKTSDEISAEELSAFSLLEVLFPEYAELLSEAFPLILQNCFAIFLEKGPGKTIINAISAYFQLPDSKPEVFFDLISRVQSEPFLKLRNEWARIALIWHTNSNDIDVSQKSLQIFYHLKSFINPYSLSCLASFIYDAEKRGEEIKLIEIFKFLCDVPLSSDLISIFWDIYLRIGFSLLMHSKIKVYDVIADFLIYVVEKISTIAFLNDFKDNLIELSTLKMQDFLRGFLIGMSNKFTFEKTLMLYFKFTKLQKSLNCVAFRSNLILLGTVCFLIRLSFLLDSATTIHAKLINLDFKILNDFISLVEDFGEESRLFASSLSDLLEKTRNLVHIKDIIEHDNRMNDVSNSTMLEYLKDYISLAFDSIQSIFNSQDNFSFVFKILKEFLQFGEPEWKKGLLWVFGVFLAHSDFKCSKEEFEEVHLILLPFQTDYYLAIGTINAKLLFNG